MKHGPAGWSGRMSPASFRQYHTELPISVRRESIWTVTPDPETGKRSWLRIDTRVTKTMRSPASWPAFQNSGTGGPTGFLTLNTSGWTHTLAPSHSDGSVCSLSDILETGAHLRRYCLSAKACRGILRRAAKRGRQLPPSLHAALERVARTTTKPKPDT